MASPLNVRRLGPGQLGAMMKTVSAQYKATGGRGARNPANATAINNAVGQQVTTFRNNQKNNAVQQQATTYRDSLVNKAVGGQHLKQRQRQENNAVAGFGDTHRARQEEKALNKRGRARRKKSGNYTAYGQTGGTLAPSGGGKGRAQVGDSHGVAIVNGPLSGRARKENKAVTGFIKEQQMQRLKTSANDGLYIDRRPRRKGRKRGRPQYTIGTGAINPKTGDRLYF